MFQVTQKLFGHITRLQISKKNKIYRTRLNKGDIIFHHTNVIHGAEKNNSKSKTRFAVSVSIVGIKSKIDNKLNKIYQKFLKSNRKLS